MCICVCVCIQVSNNSEHLLSTEHVPVTLLNDLHFLILLVLTN